MSSEDIERYESDAELQLYRDYKDVIATFRHVVETDRRFYLANAVTMTTRSEGGRTWFEIELNDAWVWDVFRPGPARFVANVKVITFKDVNIEDLTRPEE